MGLLNPEGFPSLHQEEHVGRRESCLNRCNGS